jgi:dethiobiotin synthetase
MSAPRGYFIAGTDTGVGKTHFSTLLLRALRAAGLDAAGFKPICCGDRDDAEKLAAAAEHRLPLNEINPVWLRPPVAPYTAAMVEGRVIDLALIHEAFARAKASCHTLIVEGAGGWLVPITRDFSMADLAVEFAFPVLVVAANRLGALNHTLLTVRAIQASGLPCAGVILNQVRALTSDDPATITNASVLEELLQDLKVPLLGELPHNAETLPPQIANSLTLRSLGAGPPPART